MALPIKKIIAELSHNPKIKAIYLFGSRATGKAGPLSDTDICVIAPSISEKEKRDILSYGSEKIDVVLFEDLPFTIKVRVFKEGKPLFVADRRDIDELRWRTVKEYLDFKPRLSVFLKAYLPGVPYV
ncbi:MAG: nucleotidyltransferase domain-containing protein [Nanoarchaeota archaeon]|nr:nucleotidyltransferase domain-containing protein [Nanoarchaeota archaeon]